MTNHNSTDNTAALEALLYLAGEELSFVEVAKALELPKVEVVALTSALQTAYEERNAGIRLVLSDNAVVVVPDDSTAVLVGEYTRARASGNLSKAELETLTYVAYRGPITQGGIDEVRGVNSSRSLRQLLVRGLVETLDQGTDSGFIGTKYTLTTQALTYLGVKSVADLPDYQKWHNAPEFDLNSDDQN